MSEDKQIESFDRFLGTHVTPCLKYVLYAVLVFWIASAFVLGDLLGMWSNTIWRLWVIFVVIATIAALKVDEFGAVLIIGLTAFALIALTAELYLSAKKDRLHNAIAEKGVVQVCAMQPRVCFRHGIKWQPKGD